MVWEFMHAYRVIPLDGRPHLDAKTRLYMGDSRGHWGGRDAGGGRDKSEGAAVDRSGRIFIAMRFTW
jgi:hypothetical protein